MHARQQLRQQLRQARQSLGQELQRAAAINLAAHLPDHSLLQHASHVAIYLAADGELDPHLLAEILHARGKTLALPIIHPFHRQQLLFQRYQPGMPLQPNRFGIDEPKLDKSALIPLQELDVIFMPLVGYDLGGNRLGMGGGFYDRTLGGFTETQRPTLIGLAHEVQRVPALPVQPWDVPIDAVATATQLIHCRQSHH
ncbi:5-formyltetrahydrofolate cyclo-ligase [Ferrimonas lipolytica]|uniref:5-formyltetrahydrofolate cyclo-ligase n=1 Tax=Ferrimonas lipolytica TaxID=2724191 RepID=A0A6H1UIQ1_9GAMM|nr:5-formyltetrahydrofolate cyclo-ligase [Ferrimonas lipolytica]QIZ77672.1 5-formyltetrahydrofolate cyclo-ligase [Ferrimonas lipolytica]